MDRLISFFPHFTTQGNWPIQLEVRYREEPNTPCVGFISITFLWGIGESASIRKNSPQIDWDVLQNLTITAGYAKNTVNTWVHACDSEAIERALQSRIKIHYVFSDTNSNDLFGRPLLPSHMPSYILTNWQPYSTYQSICSCYNLRGYYRDDN